MSIGRHGHSMTLPPQLHGGNPQLPTIAQAVRAVPCAPGPLVAAVFGALSLPKAVDQYVAGMRSAPSSDVVRAFGAEPDALFRLPGGEGRSWRAGKIVLKFERQPSLIGWLADLLQKVPDSGQFRVARYVPATDGSLIVDGWAATQWIEGGHVAGRWHDILRVSAAFHRALADVPAHPRALLRERIDPWAIGDRVAWNEDRSHRDLPATVAAVLDELRALLASTQLGGLNQVIHGDLGGNVLFARDPHVPPAVIDIAPYYRPAAYADAVIVADAVAWEEAPRDLAEEFATTRPFGSHLLARAVVYRLIAAAESWPGSPARVAAQVDAYSPVLAVVRE
jgi:uncharacterized protein (TIGR02569 family)